MNLGTSEVIHADSRNLPLDDDSVDLVITSPPYWSLRSYQDGGAHYAEQIGSEARADDFVTSLLQVTAECVRVLKPTGSLWVNLGDKYSNGGRTSYDRTDINGERGGERVPDGFRPKTLLGLPWRYALRCIDDLGLILRAEVIWSKPNGLPESVTDRVRRSHEQWFHFTLQPRYFSAVDEIREGYNAEPKVRGGYSGPVDAALSAVARDGARFNEHNPLGKLRGSVWTVPTEPLRVPDHLGVDHFAAFPTQWPLRITKAWCPEGGTVLDPFGGTGTTALVAKALGRHGISVDMSRDYCRLAEWRTNDRDQLAKVLGIAKADQQPEDQLGLFEIGETA